MSEPAFTTTSAVCLNGGHGDCWGCACSCHGTPEAVHPLSAEAMLPPDGGERVECAVCHRWPMASNWPNHMQSKGDHWPIWPPVAARTPDPDALREAAQRVVDAWFTPEPDGGWSNEWEWRDSMNRLRAALAAGVQPVPSEPDLCEWCDPVHQWPCPTIQRCDEPGCEDEATCGWPTRPGGTGPNGGYRRTCGRHMAAPVPTDTPLPIERAEGYRP